MGRRKNRIERAFSGSLSARNLSIRSSLLATLPPCNDNSKKDMKASEPSAQQPVLPRRRAEERRSPVGHKTQAHHRHNPSRKSPRRDVRSPRVIKRHGQQPAGHNGWKQVKGELTSRAAQKGQFGRSGFPHGRPTPDQKGKDAFENPDGQPGLRGRLPRRNYCCSQGSDAHGKPSPPGDGCEGSGAFYRLADEAQVFKRVLAHRRNLS